MSDQARTTNRTNSSFPLRWREGTQTLAELVKLAVSLGSYPGRLTPLAETPGNETALFRAFSHRYCHAVSLGDTILTIVPGVAEGLARRY